jgi:hypothetical protein
MDRIPGDGAEHWIDRWKPVDPIDDFVRLGILAAHDSLTASCCQRLDLRFQRRDVMACSIELDLDIYRNRHRTSR